MNLVACVWIDGQQVYIGRHAAERYQERVCPAVRLGVAIAGLRRTIEARGRIRLHPPKGVQIGLDLKHQYLTESWLIVTEPESGLLAMPLVIKPGGGALVATTCIVKESCEAAYS